MISRDHLPLRVATRAMCSGAVQYSDPCAFQVQYHGDSTVGDVKARLSLSFSNHQLRHEVDGSDLAMLFSD